MPPLLSEEESSLDPYTLLELEPTASEKDVKRAFRKVSLKYHPDRNPTPEAAIMFRKISLSLEILIDVAKRNYVDNKLQGERRRKAQYAEMDKKRKDMIDSLVAREEEAKKAKTEAVHQRRRAAEEEEIKEEGKRMLEEAKRRVQEEQLAAIRASKAGSDISAEPSSGGTAHGREQPKITPIDLTLILQFPATSSISSGSLTSTITSRYGPISHLILKDPPPTNSDEPPAAKKKKKNAKGKKAVIEFKEGNWGGCWACWRDHLDEQDMAENGLMGKGKGRAIEDGVKAKWAIGKVPVWVESATQQQQQSSQPTTLPRINGDRGYHNGHSRDTSSSWTFPDVTNNNGNGNGNGEPIFSSAPDFGAPPSNGGLSAMEALLAEHAKHKSQKEDRKQQEADFESMTLLKMRQLERERLEEQIRREEEEG